MLRQEWIWNWLPVATLISPQIRSIIHSPSHDDGNLAGIWLAYLCRLKSVPCILLTDDAYLICNEYSTLTEIEVFCLVWYWTTVLAQAGITTTIVHTYVLYLLTYLLLYVWVFWLKWSTGRLKTLVDIKNRLRVKEGLENHRKLKIVSFDLGQ